MKRKPNYLKHILQWGVLAAIAGTVLWANFSEKPVDVEAYCPFGGLQAFGTYLVNNSLACSMSMLQIMMGLVLAVGVILFSKLFCGYLCPLGTVGEWMGRAGKKLHLQVEVPSGSIVDKLLRVVKYVLLFTILYFTLSSSELFCKKLDPFYAVATGFKGEIVLWMSVRWGRPATFSNSRCCSSSRPSAAGFSACWALRTHGSGPSAAHVWPHMSSRSSRCAAASSR